MSITRDFAAAAASVFLFAANAAARTIDFVAAPAPDDALVAGVGDLAGLGAVEALIGAEAAAELKRAAERAGFTGKEGETQSFLSGAERFGEIHLVGVGTDPLEARDFEDFGGRAATLAKASKAARVAIVAPAGAEAAISDIAFGAAVGQYAFDDYKTDEKKAPGALVVVTPEADAARAAWNAGKKHLADAVVWARDQQSEPANVLYPEEFVARARAELRGVPNVSITVLDVPAMQRLGMNALLSVGQGSVRPSRLLIVDYRGGAAGEKPIALVGKGITFDSGGISLKPGAGMWAMKADMTGAAVVTATVMSLAKSRAPVNAVSFAALAENMPSGSASRPGDIYKAMSGKTVEILSTDAEGRLVLADAIWYAQERYDPALVVDVATLTGSISTALSDEYAGLFTRHDDVAERIVAAGAASGEEVWRMPLHPNYFKQIKSTFADIKNADAGNPGHGAGAAFIASFVDEDQPWAHLDIAGMDLREDPLPTVPKGFSAFGVRLLDRLAREKSE